MCRVRAGEIGDGVEKGRRDTRSILFLPISRAARPSNRHYSLDRALVQAGTLASLTDVCWHNSKRDTIQCEMLF